MPAELTVSPSTQLNQSKRPLRKGLLVALIIMIVTAAGALSFLNRCSRPLRLGEVAPDQVLSLIPKNTNGSRASMLIYSTADTPAGERAFRYIAVRSSHRISILPTVLVGDNKLVGEIAHVGLSCSNLCRIATDQWSILRYKLHLRRHAYHVFILDHSGIVLFSADIADTSDLQQLTQKYLDGHITYNSYEAHDVRSLIGVPLTEFPVIRVIDDAKATLPLRQAAPRSKILLFTAHCPDCSLDGLTKASNVLEATKLLTPESTSPPILLFSSRFSSFSLRQLVHVYHTPHNVYQAVGSVPSLEDLASLTLSTPADVCLITLNSEDVIIGVESFELHQGHLDRIAEQSYGTD